MQWRSDAFVLTGRRLLNASQSQGVALGYNLLGLQPVGISSHPAYGYYWRSSVVQHHGPSMNEFASFFIKYSSFFLLDIQKLCTFALNYNCRRMSKLVTIIHPQRLGNKAQGCCAARRNLSFFDTFNVEHWEHSNHLLTHIRRIHRLSPLYLYAREALRYIHLERVCHKVPLPFSHARFPTSTS